MKIKCEASSSKVKHIGHAVSYTMIFLRPRLSRVGIIFLDSHHTNTATFGELTKPKDIHRKNINGAIGYN